MRVLLFLGALLIASPAFAIDSYIIDHCLKMPNPKACLEGVTPESLQMEAAYRQQAIFQQQMQYQLEQARIQANGLALFGAGAAMINGVNQGFQNMQQPYVNTPAFQYAPMTR